MQIMILSVRNLKVKLNLIKLTLIINLFCLNLLALNCIILNFSFDSNSRQRISLHFLIKLNLLTSEGNLKVSKTNFKIGVANINKTLHCKYININLI